MSKPTKAELARRVELLEDRVKRGRCREGALRALVNLQEVEIARLRTDVDALNRACIESQQREAIRPVPGLRMMPAAIMAQIRAKKGARHG